MDEKGVSNSVSIIYKHENNRLYPMFLGVSCAFYALKLLSEPEMNNERWSKIRNILLQESAHVMGLLVWSVQREEIFNGGKENLQQKLEKAEREIEELKRRRSEDGKANEKVLGIFAEQEQCWFSERKKLQHQVGALLRELRVLGRNKEEAIYNLNGKLQENEILLRSKEKELEEEEKKRRELEERLMKAEETAKREAEERSNEILKHKTAFIELVSSQRQLEAEMGRAHRQVEAKEGEIDSVLEQKEECFLVAQKLSMEVIKLEEELEEKDKILSAVMMNSKSDKVRRKILLKEVKLSKSERKRAEMEMDRWREVSECRRERHALRSTFFKHGSSKLEAFSDQQLPEGSEKLVFAANAKHLEGWVRSEAEKFTILIEQRHHMEINAFADQLRLKDEKLEGLKRRLLSTELESKRLLSHIEGLDHDLSVLRQENMKLETLLLDQETKLAQDIIWSKVKIVKTKPEEKEQEANSSSLETQKKLENPLINQSKDIIFMVKSQEKEFEQAKHVLLDPNDEREITKKITSQWNMDLHALGVSYKIKRLKQQLLMLERLTGKQESCEDKKSDEDTKFGIKGFHSLISLLNRQIGRYESLQGKTDDICKRMHENDLDMRHGGPSIAKTKEETKILENFLDETFQLQRYIVATGQKLIEIRSKIASGFVADTEEVDGQASFDVNRFSDSVGTLFREVQRGLEVRIARIIGDFNGILACDGIIHLRKK